MHILGRWRRSILLWRRQDKNVTVQKRKAKRLEDPGLEKISTSNFKGNCWGFIPPLSQERWTDGVTSTKYKHTRVMIHKYKMDNCYKTTCNYLQGVEYDTLKKMKKGWQEKGLGVKIKSSKFFFFSFLVFLSS